MTGTGCTLSFAQSQLDQLQSPVNRTSSLHYGWMDIILTANGPFYTLINMQKCSMRWF